MLLIPLYWMQSASTDILGLYDLGHKWTQDDDGKFAKGDLVDKQPPQLLFIERCLQMLRDGGRMGIVLLESIFGMVSFCQSIMIRL